MLGQSAFSRTSSSASDSRIFVYEVTGLQQNDQTELTNFPVRNSSSQFVQVPHNRMNDEMRRITRLGGKIVGISTLGQKASAPTPKETSTSTKE
jgi:phycocyanin-associated, rod